MPDVQLLIKDQALRDAVIEQTTVIGLDTVMCDAGTLEKVLSNGNDIVVLDESAASKDTVKILQSVSDAGRGRVLLLGEANEASGIPAVAETLVKPFRLGQLLSRIQFYVNVVTRLRSAPILFGCYRLEGQTRQVTVEGTDEIIRLTEKEAAILGYLAQCDAPVGRDDLLAALWGYDSRIDTHTLETHIYQLRRKLDPESKRGDFLVHQNGGYFLKRR